MAKKDLQLSLIADRIALEKKLAVFAQANGGNGADVNVRSHVLSCLKEEMERGAKQAEKMLFEDGRGYGCAERLSHLQDVVIQATFSFALDHVFQVKNLAPKDRISVIAVGGYGRGTLAPQSDVDLLFVFSQTQTKLGTLLAEYILYMLWDLGLTVGHASRTIDDCIKLSKSDYTITTSILEARYLIGDRELFEELLDRFDRDVVQKTASQFTQAKLTERNQRHKRMGETRYVVEPNVKDGKGGLRDLHTLFWIAKYNYRVRKRSELIRLGLFSRSDYNLFVKCEDFLWAVRCHLHFLTGKAEERLSFEVQRELASRMSYQSHPGLQEVERFMKHYFLIAKDVGDLTRIFCAALEEQDLKQAPTLTKFLQTLPFSRKVRAIAGIKQFIIDNQRINVASPDVFETDPVNLIRIFHLADRYELEYHPDALQLIRKSLKLIDKNLRMDVNANKLFLNILTSRNNPALNLRRMNEAGVLGRFIPDFGKIVAMMQFNMYHHYTVDEHLIRTVGVLADIENGKLAEEHPLASEILPSMGKDRTLLYVTLLLHDIAKGRPKDHSIAGAEVARRVCPRLGFSKEETDLISWLIHEHLTMSMVAQSRDLSDRKTIENFVSTVQSVRRLKLLLVLTVCDIRAVGPGVWNGWKGQLLRTLYQESELAMTGGFSATDRKRRAAYQREKLFEALSDWDISDQRKYADLHYDNYILTVPFDDQIAHATFVRDADIDGKALSTMVRTDAFQAITEITVLAPDHPRLLSIIAAACTGAGASIDGAHIFTTGDGRALDTILLKREFAQDADELRRAKRIGTLIEEVLSGKTLMPAMLAKPKRKGRSSKTFRVEPDISVNNNVSDRFSVIEVECLDRPALLSNLTEALSDLHLDIRSAHITTFGEKVIDSFYVTDLIGQKITDISRQNRIKKALLPKLMTPSDGADKLEKKAKDA